MTISSRNPHGAYVITTIWLAPQVGNEGMNHPFRKQVSQVSFPTFGATHSLYRAPPGVDRVGEFSTSHFVLADLSGAAPLNGSEGHDVA